MTETAHAQFAEELTNVHGLVCGDDDDGSGICELMEGWKYVAAEYDHLLAAARALLAEVLSQVPEYHDGDWYVEIPIQRFGALRAAVEADRRP